MDADNISAKFNRIADQYDSQRKLLIPCFDDFYGTIPFVAGMKSDFRSILDLGAGTGILSHYLYGQFPDAEYTLMDISDRMLEVARQRFEGLGKFHYETNDYSMQLPPVMFDLIASALSIHYLEHEKKESLYVNVHKHLEPGGYFMILDRYRASSELVDQHYVHWRYNSIARHITSDIECDPLFKKREPDIKNTIDDNKNALIKAGFYTVECIYSFMGFGVILAIK